MEIFPLGKLSQNIEVVQWILRFMNMMAATPTRCKCASCEPTYNRKLSYAESSECRSLHSGPITETLRTISSYKCLQPSQCVRGRFTNCHSEPCIT